MIMHAKFCPFSIKTCCGYLLDVIRHCGGLLMNTHNLQSLDETKLWYMLSQNYLLYQACLCCDTHTPQIIINFTFIIHTFMLHLSRVVRKPAFCICENKDADQLRGNREADQRLCFRYTDSTIPLLLKSEISSL